MEPLTDDPGRFSRLRSVLIEGREYRIEAARRHASAVLLRLEGVDTRDEARKLRGVYIEIPYEEAAPLPEGAYYHFQLVGLKVETTAGELLGDLKEILPLAPNDVYVVCGERGEVLLPSTRDVIREVDLAGGRMVVEPVPGLLPWEDASR